MTGVVKVVRAALDPRCTASRTLRKDGCAVSLKEAPTPRVIVDFDKPGSPQGRSQVRCDYLVVADGNTAFAWVAPLELKKGKLQTSQVVRQLRAGANAAERYVAANKEVRFRPVAAVGKVSKKADREKLRLRANRVRFHHHVEVVRLISCGDALTKALRL